jgi:hypothetical protein
MSPLQLLPLLLVAAASAKTTPPSVAAAAPAAETVAGHHPPPVPATTSPPWPEQYHAVVITNQTTRGGRLQQIDIYYDWPRGRALNVIRDQLGSGEPLRDVEWTNGTSFLFDSASCTTFQYPVGLLPPDWKKARGGGGAAYLGRDRVDGFDCHVWSNSVFARYYEDAATGRPVSWIVVNNGAVHG